jgi:predicted ATPase/class 3 adenylate cyclase
MRQLPGGTVTFLFSDIEGSTKLLEELGADAYANALADHRRLMREAFAAHGGVEVDTQGDAFFAAFADAQAALNAAAQAQATLTEGSIRVRMGIHSGEPLLTEEGYVGIDVHRGARVMSAGHGGQVLVSQTTYALLGGNASLTELGLHRLKDLTEPQPLYQLGEGQFPPLKTLYQTNLPVQPTPLVGRERELSEVLELLAASRLVTLTGAGGSGKTRLALQAAAELVEEFKDGVWWISLAALREPELVEPTVAQVVGARDGLADHLRGKQTLLLLDNFEQLLPAAPAIADVLAEAPELRLLATSRERLAIAAEHEYQVPTLVPAEAVALFTTRARQLKGDFKPDEHVEEICRRLDGLPLALELAAARVKVLPPAQILARLGKSLDLLATGARDAPERQRTLRATIEWSYDLLADAEKELFARLAVFAGSFDLEAAEGVCDAGLDTLASLVDKSLLRHTQDGRFFMLETIHEFAAEKLDGSGEMRPSRDRHLEWFLAQARAAEEQLVGATLGHWLDRLAPDHDNLSAAVRWSFEKGNAELALELVGRLWRFYEARGYQREGRYILERGLGHADQVTDLVRAKAAYSLARLVDNEGEYEEAKRRFEESIASFRAAGDPVGAVRSLSDLGFTELELGNNARSESIAAESVRLARELGDTWLLSGALNNAGHVAMSQGKLDRARNHYAESLRLRREIADLRSVANSLNSLGWLEMTVSNLARAKAMLEEALDVARQIDDTESIAMALGNLGHVELQRGEHARAKAHLRDALALSRELGMHRGAVELLFGLAAEAVLDGETNRMVRLWGAAQNQLERMATSPFAAEEWYLENMLEPARRVADDEPFEGEWAMGRAMSLEAAVDYALESSG